MLHKLNIAYLLDKSQKLGLEDSYAPIHPCRLNLSTLLHMFSVIQLSYLGMPQLLASCPSVFVHIILWTQEPSLTPLLESMLCDNASLQRYLVGATCSQSDYGVLARSSYWTQNFHIVMTTVSSLFKDTPLPLQSELIGHLIFPVLPQVQC